MPYKVARFLCLLAAIPISAIASEVVIDFEEAVEGEWIPSWEENGVTFKLAWEPTKTKAEGKLVFFPHLATGRKAVLCAMAEEPIPVEARLPEPARSVSIRFWGATGSAAKLEAFGADGALVDAVAVEVVPSRETPGDPVPFFELTVAADLIHFVRFSGPREGEFLAADELRYQPARTSAVD